MQIPRAQRQDPVAVPDDTSSKCTRYPNELSYLVTTRLK